MMKEYRFLSFVERWGIAPRHHHQSVADHSYFVTLYCSQICEMLEIHDAGRAMVFDAALRHDADEAWSSDVPGPAKRSLFDPEKSKAYADKFAASMDSLYRASRSWLNYGDVCSSDEIFKVKDIIKVADLIDEVFYLAFEQNLGNNMVRGLYQRELSRLEQAAQALAGEEFTGQLLDLIGVQIARIGEEGAIIPANDSDIPGDPQFKGMSEHVSDADRAAVKLADWAENHGPKPETDDPE